MVFWPRYAGFLLIGYLSMSRSFAYLGIPPLRLFIGEIFLATFLLLKPKVALGTWIVSLMRPSPLNALSLAMLAFVMYGVWQVGRGVLGGSSLFFTLKYFVFNYYAVYLFLGLWVGLRAPHFLPGLVRVLVWVNGLYGIAYVVALKSSTILVPGSTVALFGQPGGSAVAILGLLCFERNLARAWLPLSLNIVVLLAMQVRAEWLGVTVGMLLWGVLTHQLGRLLAFGVAGLAMIGMIELADLKLAGRGSPISLETILSRAIAPLDKDLAGQFSPNAKDDAGTVEWRTKWWEQIWISANSDPMLEAFGHGYGFDLFSLAPEGVRMGQAMEIRTPHNVFYYALGYTGWVGVGLFALLQLTIFKMLWRAFRRAGQIVGLLWWSMGLSMAFFSNFFETPFGAIPFYLLAGLGMAPALRLQEERNASPARPQLLSATRW